MNDRRSGFTIVELLIVIVVVGILATIIIIAYNGVTRKARMATLQSDTSNNVSALEIYNAFNGSYPDVGTNHTAPTLNDSRGLTSSGSNVAAYYTNSDDSAYCVSSVGADGVKYVADNLHQSPIVGVCSGVIAKVSIVVADGVSIQDITTANCPTSRTRSVDVRDNHSYWIQEIGGGVYAKCWMLTSLSYTGGGVNTYSDTIPTSMLTNGTGGATTYTAAKYYVPTSGANVTIEPTNPSVSTNGTGQYGYLYNWCAAMGAQIGTSTCNSTSTDDWNHIASICPSGWRLPTGNWNEVATLNTAINAGRTDTDSGLIGSGWLGQLSGYWYNSFSLQGSEGDYWTSTPGSATNPYYLMFNNTSVIPAANGSNKFVGFAVRCVTND